MTISEIPRAELLKLKRQLMEEKRKLDDDLKRIDQALNGFAESPTDETTSEYYQGEQFTARLQQHFHKAKQVALKHTS
jgi:hypothetical protein